MRFHTKAEYIISYFYHFVKSKLKIILFYDRYGAESERDGLTNKSFSVKIRCNAIRQIFPRRCALYSVGLTTLGCKVSQYETEAVAEAFVSRGFELKDFSEACDVYVINTCTVTAEADAKSRKAIRRAKRKNPGAKILVMGCYSERAGDEVLSTGADFVVGTVGKMRLVEIAEKLVSGEEVLPRVDILSLADADFESMTVRCAPRSRAYVKIEDGCDSHCSYCAIAPARGRVRSKPIDEVISEVRGLTESGVSEIVLTGIEVAAYGRDLDGGWGLCDLIAELDRLGCARRIRLGSMAPELITDEFIERTFSTKIMVPHLHLSIQSGSSRVLGLMRRRYNMDKVYAAVERLRAKVPRIEFTADLMVGFPGETEEDYLLTEEAVRKIDLLDAHVFAYSRRAGTPAAELDFQIPELVKRERSERLINLARGVKSSRLDRAVILGEALPVICESVSCGRAVGHSDSYIEVEFNAEKTIVGREVLVKPISRDGSRIIGEIIKM